MAAESSFPEQYAGGEESPELRLVTFEEEPSDADKQATVESHTELMADLLPDGSLDAAALFTQVQDEVENDPGFPPVETAPVPLQTAVNLARQLEARVPRRIGGSRTEQMLAQWERNYQTYYDRLASARDDAKAAERRGASTYQVHETREDKFNKRQLAKAAEQIVRYKRYLGIDQEAS